MESIVSRKRILILVHPECFVERWPSQYADYVNEVRNYRHSFDVIFAYQSLPEFFLKRILERTSTAEIHNELIQTLTSSNSSYEKDNDMLVSALKNDISEYLIENENVDIFISGGYQDLCLREVCKNLFSILSEEISEFGHEVKIFKQLMFHRGRVQEDQTYEKFGDTMYPAAASFDDNERVESDAWFEKLMEKKKLSMKYLL